MKKSMRKGLTGILVLMILFGCASKNASEDDSKSDFEKIEIKNTYDNRKTICEKSNEYELISNPEMKKLMQENAFCYIDYSNTPVPDIQITETENDKMRPLDDKHLLIQHKEFIDSSVEKVVSYIADLDGNLIYGDIDHDYTLIAYENGRIDHEDIYRDDVITTKKIYTYEDDEHYTIKRYDHWGENSENDPDYTSKVVNGKITEEASGDNMITRVTYEGEKIIEINTVDMTEMKDLIKQRIESENGYTTVVYSDYGEDRESEKGEYNYDANGLLLQVTVYDDQNAITMGSNYYYDFDNGIVYQYGWNMKNEKVLPAYISKWDMDFYLSQSDDFKTLSDFTGLHLTPEYIYADETQGN